MGTRPTDEDLVVVATFVSIAEARLAKVALEAEQIPCHVTDEHTVSADPLLVVAVGGVKLLVRKSDATNARRILESPKRAAGRSVRRVEKGGDRSSVLASVCRSILRAGRGMLRWLFNLGPFVVAVRLTYRGPLQLATGLFVAGALVGFFVRSDLPDVGRGEAHESAGFRTLMGALERSNDADAASDHPGEAVWERFVKSLVAGKVEEADFTPDEWAYALSPRPPHASEVLVDTWISTLILLMIHTLLLVVLGFVFGVYPAGWTIYTGLSFGGSLSETVYREEGATLGWGAWYEPVWLALALACLLSAAIGLDMAKYVAQRHKGQWFQDHIRRGLKVWGTAVAPAILIAMIFLAVVLVIMVILAGDPVVT